MDWQKASDIEEQLHNLILKLDINWVDKDQIYCFRSTGSKSRAIARIWGFNKIWQMALEHPPAYCLEVIAQRYDKLPKREQDKVLLHELAHIPKNFSGALMPHTRKRKGSFHDKLHDMIKQYDRIDSSS
jgi:predicted metallopeptidase